MQKEIAALSMLFAASAASADTPDVYEVSADNKEAYRITLIGGEYSAEAKSLKALFDDCLTLRGDKVSNFVGSLTTSFNVSLPDYPRFDGLDENTFKEGKPFGIEKRHDGILMKHFGEFDLGDVRLHGGKPYEPEGYDDHLIGPNQSRGFDVSAGLTRTF